eukprot:1629916-Pyramimonas_sp.AAC.1
MFFALMHFILATADRKVHRFLKPYVNPKIYKDVAPAVSRCCLRSQPRHVDVALGLRGPSSPERGDVRGVIRV